MFTSKKPYLLSLNPTGFFVVEIIGVWHWPKELHKPDTPCNRYSFPDRMMEKISHNPRIVAMQ